MYEVEADQLAEAAAAIAVELATGDGKIDVPPIVGLKEIGLMFGVGWNTPYQWRSRKQLVKEDDLLSGNPVWRVTTIYRWAAETNRKIVWDPWGLVASGERPLADGEAEPADESRPVGRAPERVRIM